LYEYILSAYKKTSQHLPLPLIMIVVSDCLFCRL